MKLKFPILATAILVTTGCAVKDNPIYGENGVIRDRGQEYAYAQAGKRLEIPAELDAKSTQDVLTVPQINESLVASAELVPEAPRPEFFFAAEGNDRASIRPLEGDRVIIVDEPIDLVWRELQPFWNDAEIKLETSDPREGVMESEWIRVEGEDLSYLQRLLNNLKFNSEANEPSLNKLRVRLRPDPENTARTAISLQQAQIPLSGDKDQVNWSKDATELDYSNEIMFAMLNYLSRGDITATAPTLSKFEKGEGPTAQMGMDSRNQPLLNVRASGDEAWDLVNASLDAAGIDVGTRDQESGVIYLTYKHSVIKEEPKGFLEWLRARETGPITIKFPGSEEPKAVKENVVYSSDPDAIVVGAEPTQEELQNMEGFKVWMGGRVVYVFGQDNQQRTNADGDTFTYKRYQLHFNRARSGVLLSVKDDKGEAANAQGAEELLWAIKDHLK